VKAQGASGEPRNGFLGSSTGLGVAGRGRSWRKGCQRAPFPVRNRVNLTRMTFRDASGPARFGLPQKGNTGRTGAARGRASVTCRWRSEGADASRAGRPEAVHGSGRLTASTALNHDSLHPLRAVPSDPSPGGSPRALSVGGEGGLGPFTNALTEVYSPDKTKLVREWMSKMMKRGICQRGTGKEINFDSALSIYASIWSLSITGICGFQDSGIPHQVFKDYFNSLSQGVHISESVLTGFVVSA